MSFDFSCNIQMVEPEIAINNMKAWIHPAMYQRFKLMVVI